MTDNNEDDKILPDNGNAHKITRGLLQVGGGAIPIGGGVLAAIAGAWSESDQAKIDKLLEEYILRLRNEIKEQKKTLAEIIARIGMDDENARNRFESEEYQALLKKAFRNWAEIDTEDKRILIRNLLTNAASTTVTSDDVVSLFIEWIHKYSTLHFSVIGAVYNANGITRGDIWDKIGKDRVREDSAEADLYKLLFRDLSTGGIIRQHRQKDAYGNFIKKPHSTNNNSGQKPIISAFDRKEPYELTELGQQFVHYAMADLPPKLGFTTGEPIKTEEEA